MSPGDGALSLQLWSSHYAPEPMGIGPVVTTLASGLHERGHAVQVIAAHPHYPVPSWGRRILPYRERRDGIPVLRLPLWVARRESGTRRVLEDLSFVGGLLAALPAIGRPDAMVVVSPSFPSLVPAMLNARLRRIPWLLWIQDLLPDGAIATGLLPERGLVVRASRRVERAAYRSARRIGVVSRAFERALIARGVPERKVELLENPATRPLPPGSVFNRSGDPPRVLSMGNIGYTQGLAPLAAAFERSEAMARIGARLVITGDGVAASEVRAAISGDHVQMLGVVDDDRLEAELRSATLALVSQRYDGVEFNLPSKLANFMGYGLPVIAAVNPASEAAALVRESSAGWVVDSADPEALPRAVERALSDPAELERRAEAAHACARERFHPDALAQHFERTIRATLSQSDRG